MAMCFFIVYFFVCSKFTTQLIKNWNGLKQVENIWFNAGYVCRQRCSGRLWPVLSCSRRCRRVWTLPLWSILDERNRSFNLQKDKSSSCLLLFDRVVVFGLTFDTFYLLFKSNSVCKVSFSHDMKAEGCQQPHPNGQHCCGKILCTVPIWTQKS